MGMSRLFQKSVAVSLIYVMSWCEETDCDEAEISVCATAAQKLQ